jgi:hypothetical protein
MMWVAIDLWISIVNWISRVDIWIGVHFLGILMSLRRIPNGLYTIPI